MHHRVLCLHVPRFRVAIELARRPELRGAPLILHSGGERPRAVEACERAEAALVRPGMPLVRALSEKAVAARIAEGWQSKPPEFVSLSAPVAPEPYGVMVSRGCVEFVHGPFSLLIKTSFASASRDCVP